jgi:hypothetical protein
MRRILSLNVGLDALYLEGQLGEGVVEHPEPGAVVDRGELVVVPLPACLA